MESNTTDDPPSSNEAWFNQESSMILHEKSEDIKRGSAVTSNGKGVKGDQEVTDVDNPSAENPQVLMDVNNEATEEKGKDSQILSKNDISPDELNVGNEFVPTGCEVNSPEFNDDQDVEIINAFKQGILFIQYIIYYFTQL